MGKRLATVLLAVTLAACGQEGGSPGGHQRPPRPAPVVEAATVTLEEIAPVSERDGVVQARRQVRLQNQEEGRIQMLAVAEGDRVEAGQLLVRFDDRLLDAELNKARATLRQAEQDLERITGLARQKLVSEEERQRAGTAVAVARAEVRLIEARLAHTRIQAPFAGLIAERRAEAGDTVARFTHLLTLIDPASLVVVSELPETLLAGLEAGEAVEVRLDALDSGWLRGRVARIHPALDAASRMGRAEIALARWPAGAMPGQSCRVRIAGERRPRLLAPQRAVLSDAGGHYVYRLDKEGRIHRQAVTTGGSFGERIEILSGLDAGARVVVAGFLGLRDGLQVRLAKDAGGDG